MCTGAQVAGDWTTVSIFLQGVLFAPVNREQSFGRLLLVEVVPQKEGLAGEFEFNQVARLTALPEFLVG